MAANTNTLKKNLKLLRTNHGLSQEELSSSIFLTRSTYSSYESGCRVPDLQTLDALAAIYDISLDSLVNYDLSKGIFNTIYFDNDNAPLAQVLNDYQGLSLPAKYLIMKKLDILLDAESSK